MSAQTGIPTVSRHPRRGLVLAVVSVAALVVNLDNTILNVALPTLVEQLKAGTDELQWVVDAYAIVFGGLMLTAGSLADRIGRKRLLLGGLFVFGTGSAAAAFSGDVSSLILWRAVMGVGAALIIPAGLATINHVFADPGQRSRGVGVWSGVIGLGIALGPVIGGLLLSQFWWGSVFLVNVPIALLGMVGVALVVPESRSADRRPADPCGALLSIGALALVLWAIIEGPTRGWASPVVLIVGATGIVIAAVFVLWERRTPHPMLPLGYFGAARFSAPLGALTVGVFVQFGGLFLITQFLQFSLGYSALGAGLRMLPVSGGLIVGAAASRRLVSWAGSKAAVASALALMVCGLVSIAFTCSTSTTYAQQLPGLVLMGLGAGFLLPACTSLVLGTVHADDAGIGSATNSTAQQVGGAIGVAVIGSVLSTHYQSGIQTSLAGLSLPASVSRTISGSLGGALEVGKSLGGALGAQLDAAARSAFMSGYQAAVIVAAAVALAGVVLVLLTLPARPEANAPHQRSSLDGKDPGSETPASAEPTGREPQSLR